MARGFVDRFLVFMGIQEEPVEEPVPERENGRSQVESEQIQQSVKSDGRGPFPFLDENGVPSTEVAVLRAKRFEEVEVAAGILKAHRPAVVSLDGCDRELARRMIDFLAGVTYALDGHMRRIGDDVFLFTPRHIAIGEEDEEAAGDEEAGGGEPNGLEADGPETEGHGRKRGG